MKEIEITIDKEGVASIDLVGWRGKGCEEVAKKLAKALGETVKSDHKCDYWKAEQQQKQKIIRGM